jgi:hypothetical protein
VRVNHGRHQRRTHLLTRAGLLILVLLGGPFARSQDAPDPNTTDIKPGVIQKRTLRMAAADERLWLVETAQLPKGDVPQSRAYFRKPTGDFKPTPLLNAGVARLTAEGESLYAFTEDGGFYVLRGDDWRVARTLPHRVVPKSLHATAGRTYALIEAPRSGVMNWLHPADPNQPEAYDPGDAAYTVVQYDSRGWSVVASAPAGLYVPDAPQGVPRITQVNDELILVWYEPSSGNFLLMTHTPDQRGWAERATLPAADVQGFWVLSLGRVPTVLYAHADPERENTALVSAWRLLGKLEDGRSAWRRTNLSVSPMPEGVTASKYYDAGGFNQHAVLFVEADTDVPYLQFARFEAPAEPTVALTDVLSGRQRPVTPDAVRLFMPFLPLLIVFYVMIYRRETLVQPLPLPADTAPAFMLQRLLALLIDLAPFVIVGAAVMGLDWRERGGELVQWMIGSDLRELPDKDTIVWWFTATAAYSIYALVMETGHAAHARQGADGYPRAVGDRPARVHCPDHHPQPHALH